MDIEQREFQAFAKSIATEVVELFKQGTVEYLSTHRERGDQHDRQGSDKFPASS